MNRVSSSTAAWRAVYGYACADWLTIDSLQFLKTPSSGEEHSHARISAGLPQISSSLKFQVPDRMTVGLTGMDELLGGLSPPTAAENLLLRLPPQ